MSGAEGQEGGVPFRAPCANGAGLVRVRSRVLSSVRVEAGGKEGGAKGATLTAPPRKRGAAARSVPAACSRVSGVEGGAKGGWGRTFPRPQFKRAGPLRAAFACPVCESCLAGVGAGGERGE